MNLIKYSNHVHDEATEVSFDTQIVIITALSTDY